jgi:phosphatidate cytidylyltransferase
VITAIAALPFLIFLVYKGGHWFFGLVTAACFLSLYEYFRIAFPSQINPAIRMILLGISFCVAGTMLLCAHRATYPMVTILLSVNLIVCAMFSLTRFKSDPMILQNVATQVLGMIYIALSLSFLIMIRESPDGMIWIFWILGIIFAGDVGAFYVGRQFGQHKLCPSVSPGKTVEGAIGGLAANILLGIIGKFFLPELPWGQSILMAICIGMSGQIGDLFESEFKRTTGVKDSGVILPGHGGILDRIDALLFAAPVAFLFKKFILI